MAGKMVSLEITAADRKEREKVWKDSSAPYDYGLRLRLDNLMLKKLGISKLPQVGTNMRATIEVEVIEVRESDSTSGRKERCVELQVQKMALGTEPASAKEAIDDAVDGDY